MFAQFSSVLHATLPSSPAPTLLLIRIGFPSMDATAIGTLAPAFDKAQTNPHESWHLAGAGMRSFRETDALAADRSQWRAICGANQRDIGTTRQQLNQIEPIKHLENAKEWKKWPLLRKLNP